MASINLTDSQWSDVLHSLRATADANILQVKILHGIAAELFPDSPENAVNCRQGRLALAFNNQAASFTTLADHIEDSY